MFDKQPFGSFNLRENKLFYQECKHLLNTKYPSSLSLVENSFPFFPEKIPLLRSAQKQIDQIVSIIYKMTRLKFYADLIKTDQTAYRKLFVPHTSVLMSYDFHLDQNQKIQLIEVNVGSSGYLFSQLTDCVHGKNPNALSYLQQSFQSEWKDFSGQEQNPSNVLIVDEAVQKQKMYVEFLMYRDLLNRWKWPCSLHEIKDLQLNLAGELLDNKGQKVSMIYNRSTDFYFEKYPSIRSAFLNQTCCISPHPKEYLLLADKTRLCEWSSEFFLNQLQLKKEDQFVLHESLPFTAPIQSLSPAELWAKRKDFFFKPAKGYGGKSVYRGKGITRTMFERLIEESGIYQKAVPPSTFIDSQGKKWKYDIRAYVFKDQVQKLAARVYQGQLTNFQKLGSGFASIEISD